METRTSFYIGSFEIDKMGIVHHSNYPKWFEIGRRDYFKKAGIPSSTINQQGFLSTPFRDGMQVQKSGKVWL